MLVIRLARTGRTKYPTYRIVAAESARAATGKFVAQLGHYNPHTKELVLKTDEILGYLANGAQPSNTVVKLLKRENVKLPDWVKLQTKAPKPKAVDETEVAEETQPESVETAEVAEDETRVGEVAEANSIEVSDEASSTATQETAASEESAAEKAVAAEAASDEIAKA
jgi:small subunit ribosomal protein S16